MDRGRNGYYVVTDSNGNTLEARYTKNANGDYIAESKAWFSVANLVVNQDLQQYPTHLGFMMPDGSVDYQTAKALEQAFLDEKYILNPDLTNAISITGFYSNLVSQVSNSGNIYKSLSENQGLTVESIEGTRQGTLGVSTDEELSNMIKFQNAYNASSRFINVIDECTEHIINTLDR
jgi:flagellar hook-associated protein 1 FlgK